MSVLSLGACATSFQGDAKFPGGPRGCYDTCAAAGLVMSSYVFVGEYSTGCVCSLKYTKGSGAGADAASQSSAATSAAAVAVMRQMQQQQAQQSAAFMQPIPMP